MVLYQLTLEVTPTEMLAFAYAFSAARDLAEERNEFEIVMGLDSLIKKLYEANDLWAVGRPPSSQSETPRGD